MIRSRLFHPVNLVDNFPSQSFRHQLYSIPEGMVISSRVILTGGGAHCSANHQGCGWDRGRQTRRW